MRQNAPLNFPGHKDDLKHIFLIIVLWIVIDFHSWIGSHLYTYVKTIQVVPTESHLLFQTKNRPQPLVPVPSALGQEDHSLAML